MKKYAVIFDTEPIGMTVIENNANVSSTISFNDLSGTMRTATIKSIEGTLDGPKLSEQIIRVNVENVE